MERILLECPHRHARVGARFLRIEGIGVITNLEGLVTFLDVHLGHDSEIPISIDELTEDTLKRNRL